MFIGTYGYPCNDNWLLSMITSVRPYVRSITFVCRDPNPKINAYSIYH